MKKILILVPLCLVILLLTSSQGEEINGKITWPSFISSQGEVLLELPADIVDYEGITIPAHYTVGMENGSPFGNSIVSTPDITNEGVTLGRVIFYDKNISANRTLSCGSCHNQANGFADPIDLSEGFQGATGHRNSLSIADIGLNPYPGLMWDERSEDLVNMVLMPLNNGVELGILPDELVERFNDLAYYPELFTAAFGDSNITMDRIGIALAEFVKSIRPVTTKLDQALVAGNFSSFTSSEIAGKALFEQHCQSCHAGVVTRVGGYPATKTALQSLPGGFFLANFVKPHNTGLDIDSEDIGYMGVTNDQSDRGKFKIPHLKNIEVTGPYMHDGRFETIEEVIDFYSEEIQPAVNVAFNINQYYSTVFPLPFTGYGFTTSEKEDLIDFLKTLTDHGFNTDTRWADPFVLNEVPSGIHDTELPGITIAPNPIVNYADIQFANNLKGQKSLELYDLSGKKVWSHTINGQTVRFERAGLAAGNYLMRINMDGKSQTTKLLIR